MNSRHLLGVLLLSLPVGITASCGGGSELDEFDDRSDAGEGNGGAAGSGEPGTGGLSGGKGGLGGGGKGGSGKGGKGGSTTGGSDPGGAGSGAEGGQPPDPCMSDLDCQATGRICDPGPGHCVDCLFHTDCAAGQLCQDRRCIDTDTCQSSLDCTEASRPICDRARGRCVECAAPTDCAVDADCVDNRCVPFDPCRNSLDCPIGRVCNSSIGRCVDCVATPDCAMGERCVNNKCGSECVSDNQCTSRGMLCDLANGVCVECLAHADCPDVYHCVAGACVLDACAVGSSTCDGNTRMVCRTNGDGYDATPCAARQTCVEQSLASRCDDWVCTAGVTECDAQNERLVTCSTDGLRETNAVDCTVTNQICYNGACRNLVCPPNERFCEGEVLRQCSSDGASSTVAQNCASNQFCDDATQSCQNQLCVPNQPWCNGTRAQVCNARGSGSVDSGTDCANTPGRECAAGACRCMANRADCDNMASTGCETNISTDPRACGGCGTVCSSNHVPTPSCSANNCNGACESGYSDCNSDKRSDGCETNTGSDTANCGACALTCSSNHVTPRCTTGNCDGACASNYADCNANKQTDGCEIDTSANPDHCGGCNQGCSSTGMATRTCGSGNCNGTCATGFDDCNGNKRSDGCETDVRYDESNCGACGYDCPGNLSCVNGVCQACNDSVLLLGDSTTAANTAIQTALQAEGLVVTLIQNGVTTYAGSPAATNFGAVLVPVGNSYSTDMPVAGQSAIVSAASVGIGFLATEWAAYHVMSARWTTLAPLVLMTRSSATSVTSWTLLSTGHPIWNGLPTTFTALSGSINTGAVTNGGVAIANANTTYPGVVVRDASGSAGRVVYIAHAASYNGAWYADTNLMRMFSNGAKWATRCF